jgi:hypothetical protein
MCHVYFIKRNGGSVVQNLDFTDTLWTFWKLNCHALYFKLFFHVSIMCLCFVNTAVSCQLYSSNKLILFCFLFFFKEVCAPWFSAHMNVFMLKKIPISYQVNGNLKSEILTVENRSGHWATPVGPRFLAHSLSRNCEKSSQVLAHTFSQSHSFS